MAARPPVVGTVTTTHTSLMLPVGTLPSQTFIETPGPVAVVLWADFLIFFVFALKNYFGAYKPEYDKLAANAIGRSGLWNSDMVNGCGGIICMWVFGYSLYEGAISVMDMEVLFLSHALWYGQLIAMMPPCPGLQAVLLINPHTVRETGRSASMCACPAAGVY